MEKEERRLAVSEIIEISHLIRRNIFRKMESHQYGIAHSQILTLFTLSKKGAMNMSQLSKALRVSNQQMTKIADHLVEKGFVERFSDNTNRRIVLIQLTRKGQKQIKEHWKMILENMCMDFENFSDEEFQTLKEGFQMIKTVLDKHERRQHDQTDKTFKEI